MKKASMEFGQKVRNLRNLQGLSIEQLAEKAGLNDKYLGNVERGEKAPTIETIYYIITALEVTDLTTIFPDPSELTTWYNTKKK
ncbi:helix-turn-helix domain-containing protein [Mangrovibacillus cuniculi]|uniref:Helix-turn-helix transcriptional regulator n=1 Tax=Mangrovibacillus cuniculi TaxID=2593652 RepID=A0A7S8C8W6_9BACI|nr:helix-turn-helix transcriptional regulator [Mangrovibacillus cuniculi]QPC45567.1 helix-turn-helix transcriptional regulator [Mangrovibacillus cuniculi]